VICFKPFDSERCRELDLTEFVEVDCVDDFSEVFTEDDFFSVEELTLEDWEEDSSTFELLRLAEEVTTLNFAFELLI